MSSEQLSSKAVLYEVMGADLVLREVRIQKPEGREVLVKMTAAGLCHSDLDALSGHTRYDLPLVMGHEGVGRVEAVGPEVLSVKPGERVILNWAAFCGHCFFCLKGETELCETVAMPRGKGLLPGYRSGFRALDGSKIYHFSAVASFSEYTVIYETGCVPIGEDISDEVAAIIGCSVVTGLGSVFNTANLPEGSTMLVVGAGSIGQMIAQGGVIRGASVIAVIEPDKSKWEKVKEFGATHLFDNSEATPFDEISKLTGGRGLDFVFDAVATEQTIQDSLRLVRRGGTVVLVGSPHPLMKVELPMVDFHVEKRLVGSLCGSSNPQVDIPKILELYREGSLKLDELINETYQMEDINKAIEALRKSGGKYLINISGDAK